MISEKIYKNMWERVLNPFIPNKSSLEIEEMDSVLLFRNCNITIQKNGDFYIENREFPDENVIIKCGKLTLEQIQEWEYQMSIWTGGDENSSWEEWKEYNFDKNWKLTDEERHELMMKMKFDEEIYQKMEIEFSKFCKKLEDLSVEEYPRCLRIEIWGDKLLTIYNVNVFLKKEGIINIQEPYCPSKGIFIYTNEFTKKQLQQWNNKLKLWFPDERFSIWEKWKNNNTKEI